MSGARADVGLADRAACAPGQLSHGEKRALELAIALAMEPKLLLLDEPMARHPAARRPTRPRRGACGGSKAGFRCVLVEHDMTAVFALADRISVLIYGRILASGAPAEVRADPRVMRPISATRWSEADACMSTISQSAYGPAQVLFDIGFRRDGGGEIEVVHALMGRNGMGKTTTIFTHDGAFAGQRRHAPFVDTPRWSGCRPHAGSRRPGLGLCTRRRRFPDFIGRGEPDHHRGARVSAAAMKAWTGPSASPFPACRAARRNRGNARTVRRRAAGDGDRPRA